MSRRISNVTSVFAGSDGGGLDIVRQGYEGRLSIAFRDLDGALVDISRDTISCRVEYYTATVAVSGAGKNLSATITDYQPIAGKAGIDLSWTYGSVGTGHVTIGGSIYTDDIALDATRLPVAVLFFEWRPAADQVYPFVHQIAFRRGQK